MKSLFTEKEIRHLNTWTYDSIIALNIYKSDDKKGYELNLIETCPFLPNFIENPIYKNLQFKLQKDAIEYAKQIKDYLLNQFNINVTIKKI